jgi:hypothetical protein
MFHYNQLLLHSILCLQATRGDHVGRAVVLNSEKHKCCVVTDGLCVTGIKVKLKEC